MDFVIGEIIVYMAILSKSLLVIISSTMDIASEEILVHLTTLKTLRPGLKRLLVSKCKFLIRTIIKDNFMLE